MTRAVIRGLCVVLGVVALSVAQAAQPPSASIGMRTTTANGGYLRVGAQSLAFDLSSVNYPPVQGPDYAVPSNHATFQVIASGAPGRSWVVRVRLARALVDSSAAYVIPSQNLEYQTRVRTPNEPAGCVATPGKNVWLPVGDSVPIIVVFTGGEAACRLSVSLRLKVTGTEPAGSYEGVLEWSIEPSN